MTKAGLFLVFRQTKYAVTGTTLAPAGGYLEPGDSPLSAAHRELLEETGHESDHWTPLGSYAGDANRGCGTAHFFLALGAHAVADPVSDDLEEQHLLALDRREIETALRTGEFKVISWAAAVALALLALDDARAVVTSP